jgi:hypothetical protein
MGLENSSWLYAQGPLLSEWRHRMSSLEDYKVLRKKSKMEGGEK